MGSRDIIFCRIIWKLHCTIDLVAYNSKIMNAPPTKIHMYHEGKYIGPFVYGIDMKEIQ